MDPKCKHIVLCKMTQQDTHLLKSFSCAKWSSNLIYYMACHVLLQALSVQVQQSDHMGCSPLQKVWAPIWKENENRISDHSTTCHGWCFRKSLSLCTWNWFPIQRCKLMKQLQRRFYWTKVKKSTHSAETSCDEFVQWKWSLRTTHLPLCAPNDPHIGSPTWHTTFCSKQYLWRR